MQDKKEKQKQANFWHGLPSSDWVTSYFQSG